MRGRIAVHSITAEAFEEADEQRETPELRLEALADARARGVAGNTGRIDQDPAPGWAGERLIDPRGDDWEPPVAADPNAPFVYLLAPPGPKSPPLGRAT